MNTSDTLHSSVIMQMFDIFLDRLKNTRMIAACAWGPVLRIMLIFEVVVCAVSKQVQTRCYFSSKFIQLALSWVVWTKLFTHTRRACRYSTLLRNSLARLQTESLTSNMKVYIVGTRQNLNSKLTAKCFNEVIKQSFWSEKVSIAMLKSYNNIIALTDREKSL